MTPQDLEATVPDGTRQPPHSAAGPLDLDAQIERAEQRLVAREAWVRSTAQSLSQRAQDAVTPKSWLLPVLGGAAVLWLGWRWAKRRNPAPTADAVLPLDTNTHRAVGIPALPWAGLVTLGWPLLPAAWRARVSPAAATAAVSTGLLIVRRLIGRRSR